MKFERLSLILTIVPMLVFVSVCYRIFPDSFRSSGLRYQFKEAPPPAAEEPEH